MQNQARFFPIVRESLHGLLHGFAEISVPLAMELLILTSSCFPLSSTTLSVRCLRCLRPRGILIEYALIMDFVVWTLGDNSS